MPAFLSVAPVVWLVVLLIHAQSLVASSVKELVRGNGGEPQSLDPHLMEGPPEGWIAYDLYEGLVTYDEKGKLIPGQAESWTVSDDGKKWTFTLKKGLKWSDGKPLNAWDFEYSYKRLSDPAVAAPYAWFLETMEVTGARDIIKGLKSPQRLGVKALSSDRIEFSLNQPVSYFLELLAFYAFLPVPRHTIEAKGAKWTLPENAVSNGPFRLKAWQVNEKITATRNPLYWDNTSTSLDSVAYITGGDELSRFRSGEIDITNMLKSEHEKWVQKHHPEWIKSEPWMSVVLIFLNMSKPKLQSLRSREALALVIDRDSIAKSGATGPADAAWQVVPAHFEGLSPVRPKKQTEPITERTERARKLLSDLKELTISYCRNCDKEKQMAIMVAQEWRRKLGIKIDIHGYERKHFFSTLNDGAYDVTIMQWMGPYRCPAALLNIFDSQSASNRSLYRSAAFDSLLKAARTVTGNNASGAEMYYYTQAEELLMKDIPAIPLLHHRSVRLVSNKVKGYFGLNPVGRVYSRHLSLE